MLQLLAAADGRRVTELLIKEVFGMKSLVLDQAIDQLAALRVIAFEYSLGEREIRWRPEAESSCWA